MIVTNRKAHFEYHILEEFTAGVVLQGSEVKSIRSGNIILNDAFIYLKSGEVWMKNCKVSRWKQSNSLENHDDNRDKKLLLNSIEIHKLSRIMEDNGVTCVPLGVLTKNNKIKIKIAAVRGKKNWDKRESIKSRDLKREEMRGLL